MATPNVLALVDRDELIERIANGAIPSHIADELGVHKSSVSRLLSDHPEYVKARSTGMEIRLDDAENAVATADERNLPRAREMWRVITWRAEREHPARWGAKSETKVDQSITVIIASNDRAVALQQLERGLPAIEHVGGKDEI